MTENSYNYTEQEKQFRDGLEGLAGRELLAVRIQVVDPEINVVFLGFREGVVAICGAVGGEVLQLVLVDSLPAVMVDDATAVIDCAEASVFLGCKIAQARNIGGAWNGHGVEIGFDGIADQTLIISSVECNENTTSVSDALRIGRCSYKLEALIR